jgi:predicted DNA-binding transcriptional regulator YafY
MNGQARILYIIERLTKEACSTQQLAIEIFKVDEERKRRIIQNDIKLLKELYPNNLNSSARGVYTFIDMPAFISNTLTEKGREIQELLEFMIVFDSKMLYQFEKQEPKLIAKLKKELKSIYHIQEYPFEILSSPFLKEIKKAIRGRRYCVIHYQGNRLNILEKSQIHRILYSEGNWYIAVYNHTSTGFKDYHFLRINFIQQIELLSATFQRDIQIERFIEDFQSLFSLYQKPRYEVVIEVDLLVMRHFKSKKHLKSQEIIEEREKSLILRYQISSEMEILPLIKRWIPHIKIISPDSLREKLEEDISSYLTNITKR